MNDNLTFQQNEICKKYGLKYMAIPDGWKIGISKNINSGEMPINGLRHPSQNGTLGWYIWAGKEDMNNDPKLWDAIHVEHLYDLGNLGQQILKYLALPPGWRFQIDNKGYEDVWEDKNLLSI